MRMPDHARQVSLYGLMAFQVRLLRGTTPAVLTPSDS
jgi:hypothetical protein